MACFDSILHSHAGEGVRAPADCLADLHLDDIITAVTAGNDELTDYFSAWALNVDEVAYRHQVFRDLSVPDIRRLIQAFVDDLSEMRRQLRQSAILMHPLQRHGWQLHAMDTYRCAVIRLDEELAGAKIRSRGLQRLREYLHNYRHGDQFGQFVTDTADMYAEITSIRYSVHINGLHVDVDRYHDEPDYSAEVTELFDRFRRSGGRDYRVRIPEYTDMNHVEEQILDRVAIQHAEPFSRLAAYCRRYATFLDDTLDLFSREIRFYLSYLAFMDRLAPVGVPFCYPVMSERFTGVHAEESYDLALAVKHIDDRNTPVCNSFQLADHERILIVTGPNQGGKTTFARVAGQLTYLAALGCPIPAASAALTLPDRIFTHFERQESVASLHGKLDDELVRIHDILAQATDRSLIVMNESFSSTALADAIQISTDVLQRIIDIGCVAVYVSFLDELTRIHPACVSMVGGVDPSDPSVRTFHFTRRPADGLAYASALAEKYRLNPQTLSRRVAR